jgi:uncharacterized protein YbaP (TraB family)
MPSIALLLFAGFAVAGARTGKPASDTGEPALDVVLVRDELPGPALWKVSSGDHVLWIQGEVAALPMRMEWRSKEFERLLKESQEVIVDDSDRAPDFPRREVERLTNPQKLPRGQTLQEHVSPGMYVRLEAIQETFDIPGDLESERPWAAASRLYVGVFYRLDLRNFRARETATKLARKAKVRVTMFEFKPTFAEHRDYLKSAWGDECLSRVVEILEDGGFGIRRLANAWSIGDIDQLRNLVPAYEATNAHWGADEFTMCLRGGPQRAREYFEQRTTAWLRESERVLRDHRSTVAVMPIGWLLAPDGYVAQLRARGYEVVEPE